MFQMNCLLTLDVATSQVGLVLTMATAAPESSLSRPSSWSFHTSALLSTVYKSLFDRSSHLPYKEQMKLLQQLLICILWALFSIYGRRLELPSGCRASLIFQLLCRGFINLISNPKEGGKHLWIYVLFPIRLNHWPLLIWV